MNVGTPKKQRIAENPLAYRLKAEDHHGAKDNHLDDDCAHDHILILLKRYLKSRCGWCARVRMCAQITAFLFADKPETQGAFVRRGVNPWRRKKGDQDNARTDN